MRKRAIVTGADSGIGRATAQRLAESGFDVGITYRSDEEGAAEAAAVVEEGGAAAEVRRMDLADLPAAADVIDELAGALGGIDLLVNNAGRGPDHAFLDVELDHFRSVVEVDLNGAFLCSQRAARRMRDAGGGRIVNVTSVHEQVPLPGAAAYCAAKGGLAMLTKVMALELAEHGIAVNAVAPGEIATPMTGQHETDPRAQERGGIPLGRPGDAHEIANVVAFLGSDQARYVTGQSWIADGGMLLMAAVR